MSDISFHEWLDWLWRILVAHSITFYLLFLGVISFSIPLAGQAKPYFLLMAIYYWAVYRPTLIPPLMAFALGLCVDLITFMPFVGIQSVIYLAVQWVVRGQRTYFMGQPFLMLWLGFVVSAITAGFLQFLVFALLSWTWPQIEPTLFSIVLSILLFPFVAFILSQIHRILPSTGKLA